LETLPWPARRLGRYGSSRTLTVLAKAFRGELVPTEAELARRENRTNEPLPILLARIRAEREQAAASEKPGRRNRQGNS